MGTKPSTAASKTAAKPKATGTDAISVNAMATETVPSVRETTPTSSRFGMPHALVIIACIATAAILAPPDLGVRDILLLLGGAGVIGAGVVVTVMTGGRSTGGRIRRFMHAYFTAGE